MYLRLLALGAMMALCGASKVPVTQVELFAYHTREVLWSHDLSDICTAVSHQYASKMDLLKEVIDATYPYITKRIRALQNTNVDFIFEGYIAGGLLHVLTDKLAGANAMPAKEVDAYILESVDSSLNDAMSALHNTVQHDEVSALLSIPALAMLYINEDEGLATELWNVLIEELTLWMNAHAEAAQQCKEQNFPFHVNPTTDSAISSTLEQAFELIQKREKRDQSQCPQSHRLSVAPDAVSNGESLSCADIMQCEHIEYMDPKASIHSIITADMKTFVKQIQTLREYVETWQKTDEMKSFPTLMHILRYIDAQILPRLVLHGIDLMCPPSWLLDTACYPIRYLFMPSAKQQLQNNDVHPASMNWLPHWQTIMRNSNLALIKQSIQTRAALQSNATEMEAVNNLSPSLRSVLGNYTTILEVSADAVANKTSETQVSYTKLKEYITRTREDKYYCIDGVASTMWHFWGECAAVFVDMCQHMKVFESFGYIAVLVFFKLVEHTFLSTAIWNSIMTLGAVVLGCCIVGAIVSCFLLYYYFWWTVVCWTCVVIYFTISPVLALVLLATYWYYKRKA